MSLAIECGATSSDVILVNDNGIIQKQIGFGSANYRLMNESKLEAFFQDIRDHLLAIPIHRVGIGMPGIIDDDDQQSLEKVIRKLWPDLDSLWIGNDLESALACLDDENDVKAIIIAGTGSCCYGTNGKETGKIGGYGHRIGDRGSAYAISEKAFRMALRQHEQNCPVMPSDLEEVFSTLLSAMMKHLGIRSLKELIKWSISAEKNEIADLAPLVLFMWKQKNEIAMIIIGDCIADLCADCKCLIEKLLRSNHSGKDLQVAKISIGLTGSLFSKDNEFAEAFQQMMHSVFLQQGINIVSVQILRNTTLGSLKMFKEKNKFPHLNSISQAAPKILERRVEEVESISNENEKHLAETILPVSLGLSLTEKRNVKSMNLDKMHVEDAIDLMISEEQSIFDKIVEQKKPISILIEKVCRAFKNGGRLIYVGAGTSGRLGILDATECPPTFSSPHDWVQGIIAGGILTVGVAKEGAEDSILDGMKAIDEKHVNEKDVVVGIAACGRTPFVWGSIHRAKSLDAFTAFLTFNTELKMNVKPDLLIAMNLGAEILTGSTRLKCGTATKCILNMLSTLAMVQYGKCFENLMVDLNPSNEKLKQRSLRIVLLMTSQVEKIDEAKAREILVKNKYDIRKTVQELRGEK